MCRSEASCLAVVPDATSEWKPEQAPHAIVMKRNGKSGRATPFASAALQPAKASRFTVGAAAKTPRNPSAIIA